LVGAGVPVVSVRRFRGKQDRKGQDDPRGSHEE
jgi:hypothetical protein